MSTRRRSPRNLALPTVKPSAKPQASVKIEESRVAVSTGNEVHPHAQGPADAIEISSDESSNYGDVLEDEEMASDDETKTAPVTNGKRSHDAITGAQDVDMEEGKEDDASDAEPPTFGDLIRGSTTVDVPSSLAAQQSGRVTLDGPQSQSQQVALASMGTVLNQALRTDDTDLLESCLVISDGDMIQKTVDRLDSVLAGVLLRKLTARMHRRPGRAFGLMRWMQWTLVAHGGALASQAEIVKELSGLNRVLDERSRGLPSLLALKGKLDMQDSQLKLHKMHRSAAANGRSFHGAGRGTDGSEEEEEEDDGAEEDIVYVENEEHDPSNKLHGVRRGLDAADDVPGTNGLDGDSDDYSEDDNDEGPLLDIVAEESLDEDEVDHDDVEESGEEDDSEGDVPPSKVQRTAKGFSKRR